MNQINQSKIVLELLKQGPLTQEDALIDHNINRFSNVVSDLIRAGYPIEKRVLIQQTPRGRRRVCEYYYHERGKLKAKGDDAGSEGVSGE